MTPNPSQARHGGSLETNIDNGKEADNKVGFLETSTELYSSSQMSVLHLFVTPKLSSANICARASTLAYICCDISVVQCPIWVDLSSNSCSKYLLRGRIRGFRMPSVCFTCGLPHSGPISFPARSSRESPTGPSTLRMQLAALDIISLSLALAFVLEAASLGLASSLLITLGTVEQRLEQGEEQTPTLMVEATGSGI
ncbi:hypothetical protein BJX63DRAFT_396149 [Aspergillus granulosus]|uniref:Uncharacterized protein n=1 Tax=Aspergillus granulosus TaxID=176169 RepID=A0ABR4HAZ3_9EURO